MRMPPAFLACITLAAVAAGPRIGQARTEPQPLHLAMMDMMPMGGGQMPPSPAAQAPAAGGMPGMMGDDAMRMGPGAQGGASAGMPGMPNDAMGTPQGQAPMAMVPMGTMQMPGGGGTAVVMCPMMAMMQGMMRMGGGPQAGAMPAQPPAAPGAGMSMPGGTSAGSAQRLEGRIAQMRAELRITDAQAAAWDAFAAALRAGREHLDAARDALHGANTAADPMARLVGYENHIAARLESIRTTRLAFNALSAQLDDAQKRIATTLMLPFIGTF
ncbi:MAG: Spy/CpxP family protein refolding chaperone [Acetobacteraceae bacterium]|nr:Spy/CpxP family protein refolding chaperone [Acetobacteraceae bacterium]